MNLSNAWLLYLAVGLVGGIVGEKIKIPAGSMIISMLLVIAFQLATKTHWNLPKGFNFGVQVILGVMLGATFEPAMLPMLRSMLLPVLTSTVTLRAPLSLESWQSGQIGVASSDCA